MKNKEKTEMRSTKKSIVKRGRKSQKKASKVNLPWRINQSHWTDTLFDKSLLKNPSRLTSTELAEALEEHNEWRRGTGKYFCYLDDNPLEDESEMEAPFSAEVLGRILDEAAIRLKIIGDLVAGRFKKGSPLCPLSK